MCGRWKVKVLVTQSCPTLCDPTDCSPPGSSVCRILQARILEWVAMPSSRGSSRPRGRAHVSCISSFGRWILDHLSHLSVTAWLLLLLSFCLILLWVWVSESCSVVSDSLQLHGLHSPWNSPGQNTGVDGFSHLQGIFPTQGLNPGLPYCRQILYQLSH